ncbi:hypothetical protein NHX12_032368 [Muraenolepis orangiensis]|uniref:Secreted protein n=1 Tax=Muraenolepis orangiensis TaxID=630683 RepID=A0A9Q0E5M3_9TELE|nr:hypothetical protein NHX12_032368 [Muraenolepis orangiensis]
MTFPLSLSLSLSLSPLSLSLSLSLRADGGRGTRVTSGPQSLALSASCGRGAKDPVLYVRGGHGSGVLTPPRETEEHMISPAWPLKKKGDV